MGVYEGGSYEDAVVSLILLIGWLPRVITHLLATFISTKLKKVKHADPKVFHQSFWKASNKKELVPLGWKLNLRLLAGVGCK